MNCPRSKNSRFSSLRDPAVKSLSVYELHVFSSSGPLNTHSFVRAQALRMMYCLISHVPSLSAHAYAHIYMYMHTHTHMHSEWCTMGWPRWVGSLNSEVFFYRVSSLLYGSFAKKTYNLKEPTNRSHLIPNLPCAFVFCTRIRTHIHVYAHSHTHTLSPRHLSRAYAHAHTQCLPSQSLSLSLSLTDSQRNARWRLSIYMYTAYTHVHCVDTCTLGIYMYAAYIHLHCVYTCILFLSFSLFLSLFLSLSSTHTLTPGDDSVYTRTLRICMYAFALSFVLSLLVSLSLKHTHSHVLSLTRSLYNTLTHTHTHTYTHFVSHTRTRIQIRTHACRKQPGDKNVDACIHTHTHMHANSF